MDNLDSSVIYQTMPVLHFSIVFHARVPNVFGFYILSTLHNVAISQICCFQQLSTALQVKPENCMGKFGNIFNLQEIYLYV